MKRKLLILCALLSASAFGAGSSGTKLISELYVTPADVLVKTAENDWDNPDSCDLSNSLVLLKTHDSYDTMIAFLLSAQARKVKIRTWVTGCHERAGKTYPLIYGLSSYTE